MIGLILLAVGCYYSFTSKPDPDSFRKFIAGGESNEPSSSKGWFSKVVSKFRNVPEFQYHDYLLFSYVSLSDGSAHFLGWGNRWWLLSKLLDGNLNPTTGEEKNLVNTLDLVELEKEKAHKAKLKKNYIEAAQFFLKASQFLKDQKDEESTYEQAVCLEEAYKAFKQGNQLEKGLNYLEQAASKFGTSTRRATRGARLYDQLGEHYNSLGKRNQSRQELVKACKMYEKAAELYDMEGDSRSVYSISHQAELASELGLYEEAIHSYDKVISVASEDRLLQFKLKDYLVSACLCVLAKDGWEEFTSTFHRYQDLYPAFNSARESQLLNDLIQAKSDFDLEKYETTLARHINLTPLPIWQSHILDKAKTGIQQEDLC
ncbi:hypothetical protein K7432_007674 [Basidiobolus ranarum]|uniref:Uncharacterized protein n=1 Tax=Basidiobolus ranarum TaxID=34480 RepID=A0ABR2VZR7_9FUNG